MPNRPPTTGGSGAERLLALVGRSAPPHRPVGGLLDRWYTASGTAVPFDEWADPAARTLANAVGPAAELRGVEDAVVGFAQARAGAGHDVEAVAADLVALGRLAWPTGTGHWGETVDPVGLLARALGAWAAEHAAARSARGCLDPVTGLATADYLQERVRELHGQCQALAIAPQMTFAALAVQLDLGPALALEQLGLRVVLGRTMAARFRSGETIAVVANDRMVAVMPAYGVDRAVGDLITDLAGIADLDEVGITIGSVAFAEDAAATFRSLAGTPVGP